MISFIWKNILRNRYCIRLHFRKFGMQGRRVSFFRKMAGRLAKKNKNNLTLGLPRVSAQESLTREVKRTSVLTTNLNLWQDGLTREIISWATREYTSTWTKPCLFCWTRSPIRFLTYTLHCIIQLFISN